MSRSVNQNSQAQITLRGLPTQLLKELKSEARRRKVSVNQVLLDRLSPQSESSLEGACSELLTLSGTWDAERLRDFENASKGLRPIDSELWED